MIDRFAVIDIGSNSIRLVVYGAPLRAPTILFNEKVMAALGRGVSVDGRLDARAMKATLAALRRFRALAAEMGVAEPLTVATAAVRQAENGEAFLAQIRETGLAVTLLSGEEEAEAAGLGVISGFENANGIVGDLGGGSLELARIKNGKVLARASFPIGVLRIAALRAQGKKGFERQIAQFLKQGAWSGAAQGLPFYLIGGSWRALARLHMHLTHHPLPILHHYTMPPQAATRLVRAVARMDSITLKAIVSGARLGGLGDAAALLSVLVQLLQPEQLILSANGLREGLLFGTLTVAEQARDPLIEAARAEGGRQGRFAEHGDLLARWIAPLFETESAEQARLRHTACLLGDIGWAANPDFRAERGLEAALHGNWLGLTPNGRALIGQALFSAFGGGSERPTILAKLASEDQLNQARCWGLAIRLGHRLGGGVGHALEQSRLLLIGERPLLEVNSAIADLRGEAVDRRLKQLAAAMNPKSP